MKLYKSLLNQFDSPNHKLYIDFLCSYVNCPNLKFYQHYRKLEDIVLPWLFSLTPNFESDDLSIHLRQPGLNSSNVTASLTCWPRVDLSISTCTSKPQSSMLMNWGCCLFNFRNGSSLKETLIISRLNVSPGKWRSRTLKVSILVSLFLVGLLKGFPRVWTVFWTNWLVYHRFCCIRKRNGLWTS